MRISDWSSDVCSSDLVRRAAVSRPTQRSPSIQSTDIRDDHEDAFGRPRCGPQPHRICLGGRPQPDHAPGTLGEAGGASLLPAGHRPTADTAVGACYGTIAELAVETDAQVGRVLVGVKGV